jgi:putative ABC transport system permease protein
MALLATGIVVHLIATAGRMRRREFAVLRALGFTPRQVRASTAWQATTLGSVSMVGGGVIGIIAGRALWRVYTDRLAVVAEPAQPWLAAGLLLIAVLLLANLVAWVAGRPAARFRPAEPLRTE